MAKAMLADLIGSADNLSEPIPQSNRKETIQGVTISLMILAVLCSILRLYTRVRILKAPGWDDLLVGLAQVGLRGRVVCSRIWLTRYWNSVLFWWEILLFVLVSRLLSDDFGIQLIKIGPDNGMGKHFILLGGLEPMQTYLKVSLDTRHIDAQVVEMD